MNGTFCNFYLGMALPKKEFGTFQEIFGSHLAILADVCTPGVLSTFFFDELCFSKLINSQLNCTEVLLTNTGFKNNLVSSLVREYTDVEDVHKNTFKWCF